MLRRFANSSRAFASAQWPTTTMVLMLAFAALVMPQVGKAQDSAFLSMFRKKQEPKVVYLKPEHGPWMVLAATFEGDEAEDKATQLSLELQQMLNLPAFVMTRSRDGKQVLGLGERMRFDAQGNPIVSKVQRKYANSSAGNSFAVLVGEFNSTDDPRIDKTLGKIRTAQPSSLTSKEKIEDGDSTASIINKMRTGLLSRVKPEEATKYGPMAKAFKTRNPLLPADFFQSAIDDFVVKLNKQVEYSLLDCPGKFTVRVASFYGNGSMQIAKNKTIGFSETSSALDLAAMQADTLVKALRKKGVDAYQFHNRTGSFVTIGSFEQLGQEVRPGEFQYHPELMAVSKEYCGMRRVNKRTATGAIVVAEVHNSLDNIPFDIEGKPMAVPRRETNKLYSKHLLGSR